MTQQAEKKREETLTPAEAVYGLVGWLSSRRKMTTFSAQHSGVEGADIVREFCEANGLGEPRDGFSQWLNYPEDVTDQKTPQYAEGKTWV